METVLRMDWAGKRGYRMIFNEENSDDCDKYKDVLNCATALANVIGKDCSNMSWEHLHIDE